MKSKYKEIMNIENAANYEIIEFLRTKRELIVFTSYDRKQIEKYYDLTFNTDEDWEEFLDYLDSSWAGSFDGMMFNSMIENYKEDFNLN